MFEFVSIRVRVGAAVLASIFVACTCVVVAASTAGRADAASCGDGIVVLGARGSGEPSNEAGGLGNEVKASYDALTRDLRGRGFKDRIRYQAVPYPASRVPSLIFPGPPYFFNGLTEGVSSAVSQLAQITVGLQKGGSACAGPRIVLMGFSQGAMVMHRVLEQLSPDGARADAQLLSRIGAVLLIADGDKQPGDTSNLYPVNNNPRGSFGVGQRFAAVSGSSKKTLPEPVRARTFSVCIPQDVVCDAPATPLNAVRILGGSLVHGNIYKGTLASATGQYGAVNAIGGRLLKLLPPPATSTTKPTTTTTNPPTTTPPPVTTPPAAGTCVQPPNADLGLVMPPAKFGEYYDQVWRVPAFEGCAGGWGLTRDLSPVQYHNMNVDPVYENGAFGKVTGMRVYGTPTYEQTMTTARFLGIDEKTARSGPVVVRSFDERDGEPVELDATVCWGVLDDDGTYPCNK